MTLFRMTTEQDYLVPTYPESVQEPMFSHERVDAGHLKNCPKLIPESTVGATEEY